MRDASVGASRIQRLGWLRVALGGACRIRSQFECESYPWIRIALGSSPSWNMAEYECESHRWMRVALGNSFFWGSDAGRTRHRQRLFWTVFWSLFKGINFCLVLINPNPNSAVQKPATIIVSSHVLRISGNFDYSFDSCLNWLIFYLDHQLQGVWRFKVNLGAAIGVF